MPALLWQLVEIIPEGCRLRLGMTNPPYILEHLEEMAKILNHPRVYSFLHVPVQSGSDQVLADMKREYCRQDFEHVVEFLQKRYACAYILQIIVICHWSLYKQNSYAFSQTYCNLLSLCYLVFV